MKEENQAPYSYKEASTYGEEFPDRGVKYYKCNTLIPQFQLFSSENIEKLEKYIKKQRKQRSG